MSSKVAFGRLAKTYLKPVKPRTLVSLDISPTNRIRDLKKVQPKGTSSRAPRAFPTIQPSVIWRASEEQETKTKRRQQPHMKNWRVPVNLLAGDAGKKQRNMPFVWMRMSMREMKNLERAGGLEPTMFSMAAKNFSREGKLLKHALFEELHRINIKKSKEERARQIQAKLNEPKPAKRKGRVNRGKMARLYIKRKALANNKKTEKPAEQTA